MIESLMWGSLLRFVQLVINAAPWIVTGFFTASVFRVMVGPEQTRKLFGGGGWRGLLYGWLWGMLLPVCSLGVIPIVRELHRSGVKGGTLIAFALTAPLFNPLSVLYGLTLSDPLVIVTFAFCSLIIVSSVGFVWDRIFSAPPENATRTDEGIEHGIKRMIAIFKTASEMLFGPASIYILIGILGSVAVSILLPHGAMSTMVERDNWLAPLITAGLGIPIYSTPLLAMSQIGSMFQHGNSIGAAFSLLIFGTGVNLGLLICFLRLYGWQQILVFFSLLLVVSLGLAYLISEPLFPRGVEVAGHTHAFDIYTNPFVELTGSHYQITMNELEKHWVNHELGGTPLLLGMILLGIVFAGLQNNTNLNSWLVTKSPRQQLDRTLPASVVVSAAVTGLLALSIVGCYIYYPGKTESLEQMSSFNIEVVSAAKTGNWEGALKWISYQEDLARRLEVGAFIRSGQLSEYHRTKARVFRERLELLKHEVEDQDRERANQIAMQTYRTFYQMKRAFLTDGE